MIFLAVNVALRIRLPGESFVHVPWLVPAIEVVLLVMLLTSDATGATERRLRGIVLVLVGLVIARAVNAFT